MSSLERSLPSYVDPKRQYRHDAISSKSSTPVPLHPSNPFYDVSSWDCFPNNTSTYKGSSVSSSSSMEREFHSDPVSTYIHFPGHIFCF